MRLALRLLPLAFAVFVAGCSKPEPPTLTPKSIRVTRVSTDGIDVVLHVEAYNPNVVDISTRTITGKVVLDGKYELGAVTVAVPVVLPSKAHTPFDVPLAAKWSDLGAMGGLAAQSRSVAYTFDGTVNVGGERLNVDIPVHMNGTVTHEQLVQATLRSLFP